MSARRADAPDARDRGVLRPVPADGGIPGTEPVREVVLRAATSLLAIDSGASLAEIAAAAGVGRTTVHRIFPTRSDLITALAMQALDRLREALAAARLDDGPVPEVVERVVQEVLPLADELRFLDAGPEVWDLPQLRDAWLSVAAELDALVRRGQVEGDVRGDVPAELIVEAFTASLWGVWSGVQDGRVAPATAAHHLVALTLGGIRPPSKR
jgi:AcrR family transcriptional regulator